MASYVSEVVGANELVRYSARRSLVAYWINFVLGTFFLIGSVPLLVVGAASKDGGTGNAFGTILFLFLFGAFLLVYPFIARTMTELVITNRRVIAKFGVISRETVEIQLPKIESIRVRQSVLGRIFNYGSIIVVGTGETKAPIPCIAHPLAFRIAFDSATAQREADDIAAIRAPLQAAGR